MLKLFQEGIKFPSSKAEELYQQERDIQYCNINKPECEQDLMKLCSIYTKDDLNTNAIIKRVCGCFLPDEEYKNISRDCDTACSINIDGIQRNSKCSSNYCILDGVDINIIDSKTSNINVIQNCSQCSTSTCVCIINDLNIAIENSRTGTINIDQNCNSSVCYVNNVEVPCDSFIEGYYYSEDINVLNDRYYTYVFWLCIISIIVLVLLMIFRSK